MVEGIVYVMFMNALLVRHTDFVRQYSGTDKTWKSPSCNKLFVNGTGLAGTGNIIYDRKLSRFIRARTY